MITSTTMILTTRITATTTTAAAHPPSSIRSLILIQAGERKKRRSEFGVLLRSSYPTLIRLLKHGRKIVDQIRYTSIHVYLNVEFLYCYTLTLVDNRSILWPSHETFLVLPNCVLRCMKATVLVSGLMLPYFVQPTVKIYSARLHLLEVDIQ